MIWTIPNLLTFARLAAAPALVLVYVLADRPQADRLALVLFVAAGITDWLDGWLARRLGQESALGRTLDPIADKAMVLLALLALLVFARAPEPLFLPAALIVFREIVVSGLRERVGGLALRVTWLAKVKTVVQFVAIAALFAVEPLFVVDVASAPAGEHWVGLGDLAQALGTLLLWIAAVLGLVTGLDYASKAMRYIGSRED